MGRLYAVEIVYRGIFQKNLAKNISRAIVLAAHKEGKPGISFGRYGDSPERNGIPAKAFAIVATDDVTLEEGMAKYEPQEVDVSICVDDTMFKGVESWAWYGLQPNKGNPEQPYKFDMPKWTEMREGIAIPSIARGHAITDPVDGKQGGFKAERNPTFKKYATRTMRPVVDFDKCIKCTLCWLACPDSVFDVTPDGFYDANMEACCGCGVCEAVCPEPQCITMVMETQFSDNASQWEAWRKDAGSYKQWVA